MNRDELRESFRPDPVPGELTAAERDLIRADLGQLLETLGLGDYARPESPHEVFLECLASVRQMAAFVRSLPCRCGLGASAGEDQPCGRCMALGQRCGKDEPR